MGPQWAWATAAGEATGFIEVVVIVAVAAGKLHFAGYIWTNLDISERYREILAGAPQASPKRLPCRNDTKSL